MHRTTMRTKYINEDSLVLFMNPNSAELVGIILGDGYIKKNREIKISFNSRDDFDYIYYVRNLIYNLFQYETPLNFRKDENTAELRITKREIINYFLKEGLEESPKWNKAEIPKKYVKFKKYVLRGLFDTDGCLVKTNNNGTLYPRLELKICPSPMQKQIIKILEDYKFKFGVYQIGKGQVRIQMNGRKQLERWKSIISFSNKKHMSKYDYIMNISSGRKI